VYFVFCFCDYVIERIKLRTYDLEKDEIDNGGSVQPIHRHSNIGAVGGRQEDKHIIHGLPVTREIFLFEDLLVVKEDQSEPRKTDHQDQQKHQQLEDDRNQRNHLGS